WQLSGYVMALFLAGFRGVPDELREAARMDGATEFQMYRLVIFPQLTPVVMSALVIIAHMSLKSFDLIMSISKPANYQTKVPAVDMFLFKTSYDYANSAAVGTILLAVVAVLIVPYLINQHRENRRCPPRPFPPRPTPPSRAREPPRPRPVAVAVPARG